MSPWRLAWLELSRHQGATALSLLALGFTVACAGALVRLHGLAGERFAGLVRAGDALVGAKAGRIEMLLGAMNLEGPYPETIPHMLYRTLTRQESVGFADRDVSMRDFQRLLVPLVYCARFANYRVLGTSDAFLRQPGPGAAPALALGRWVNPGSEVVLGAHVARVRKLKIGDSLRVFPWTSDDPLDQPVLPYVLRVSGVLAPMGNAWDRALFTDLREARNIMAMGKPPHAPPWEREVLHYLLVYLAPEGWGKLRELIDKRTVAQAVRVDDAVRALEELTGTGKALGGAIILLVLFLGGVSVAGLMLGRFEAKTRQLALLEAMGFSSSRLRAFLAWEGFLLGGAAVALGGILDAALFPMLQRWLFSGLPAAEAVRSPLWQAWPVWGLALAAAMLASLIPLWRLRAAHPMERLRNLS